MVLFPLSQKSTDGFGPKDAESEGTTTTSSSYFPLENISRYPPARVGRACDFTQATQDRLRLMQSKEMLNAQATLIALNNGDPVPEFKETVEEVNTTSTGGAGGGKDGSDGKNNNSTGTGTNQNQNDKNSGNAKGKGKNGKDKRGQHLNNHQMLLAAAMASNMEGVNDGYALVDTKSGGKCDNDGYALVDTKSGGNHANDPTRRNNKKGGNNFFRPNPREQLKNQNYQEGIVGKIKKGGNQGPGGKGMNNNNNNNNNMNQGKGSNNAGNKGQGKNNNAKAGQNQKGRNNTYNNKYQNNMGAFRDWSISVRNDWSVVTELPLAGFVKMVIDSRTIQKTDIMWCGKLHKMTTKYDKVSLRKPRSLPIAADVHFYNPTTSQDEILGACLEDDDSIQVLATDHILAMLMAAGRSVYSWDIVVKKIDDKIILDKRDGSTIDFYSVNETSAEPPSNNDTDSIDSPPKLAKEAARCNQNFAEALLETVAEGGDSSCVELDGPHPFVDQGEEMDEDGNIIGGGGNSTNANEKTAGVCYRYRKIVIPGNKKADLPIKQADVVICVRTEVNCATVATGTGGGSNTSGDVDLTKYNSGKNEVRFVSTKCLNEYIPPSVQAAKGAGKANNAGVLTWNPHLETQPGAILATELKNNSFKVARWVSQAFLSGCDLIKLGYVCRSGGHAISGNVGVAASSNMVLGGNNNSNMSNSNMNHQMISVQNQPTSQLSAQISLSENNGYGILRHIIDMIKGQPDGDYLLLKDPTKPIVRFYSVPENAFETDSEDEDDGNDDDSDDE